MSTHTPSKISTLRKQVWEYLRDHPESSTLEITLGLHGNDGDVRLAINQLLGQGLVGRMQHRKTTDNFCGYINYFRYTAIGSTYSYQMYLPAKPKAKAAAPAKPVKEKNLATTAPAPQAAPATGFFDPKSFRSYCEGQSVGALRQMRSIIQEMFG